MIVADLTADHIGQTISFPTWSALGYCRRGELTFIAPPTGQVTTTLVIGDHNHTCPDNARVDILSTTEVRGL
jgi:hypothetical protein